SQFALGLSISLAKPTGIHDQGWLSRPASSTSTLCRGSALSLLASTEPAEPAPTTMKSKLGWSIFRPAICTGHKRSAQGSAALRGASTAELVPRGFATRLAVSKRSHAGCRHVRSADVDRYPRGRSARGLSNRARPHQHGRQDPPDRGPGRDRPAPYP